MALLGGILGVLGFALWVYGLFDVLTTPESVCRNLPRQVWIVLVVFLPGVGAAAWLAFGRVRPGWSPRRGAGHPVFRARPDHLPPARQRPIGPDDDPEFLRLLEHRIRRRRDRPGDDR